MQSICQNSDDDDDDDDDDDIHAQCPNFNIITSICIKWSMSCKHMDYSYGSDHRLCF